MSTNAEHIASIVSTAEEALFEKFDSLHKRNIHDDEVIHFLRDEGHKLLADRYIEWSGALDPDREDLSTLGGVVPDPGDSPSYIPLQESLSGIKQTGKVNFGGIDLHFGRDKDGALWVRPIGGIWVRVVEEGK